MKKIAIFQTDLNIGGIQKSCVNILNNIDTKKYNVDLYLIEKNNIFLKDINKNINIHYIKKLPYFTKIIPIRLLMLFYNNHISEEYDIVIDFNSYSKETAIQAIKTKAKKRIAWIHNDYIAKMKEERKFKILYLVFQAKYRYFDAFYGVSKGSLSSFQTLHNYQDKEYVCLPNIIDTKEIKKKMQDNTTIKVNSQKINICSTGRIIHQKGYDLLLEELYKIKDKLDNYQFYIIGGGRDEEKIKSLIEQYELNNYVTMLGYQSNPYPIMKQMDAFILMSRYEGQGMVLLEALALDLDIIMPKHLEKYVDGIKGTDNIGLSILNIQKRKHKFNNLDEYNQKIINQINNL